MPSDSPPARRVSPLQPMAANGAAVAARASHGSDDPTEIGPVTLGADRHPLWCYITAERFEPEKPTAVLLHGVLNDHSVWADQTRGLEQAGWKVVAPDLAGHGRSAGPPAASVETAAQALWALVDAIGVQRAALVGHSLGSLVALEAAALAPNRVSHLALVATAAPMRVSAALIDLALTDPEAAIRKVAAYSKGLAGGDPARLHPGGDGKAPPDALLTLMLQLFAQHAGEALLHRGLAACNAYTAAVDRIRGLDIPVLFVLGRDDRMTPPATAQPLIDAAMRPCIRIVPSGHSLMLDQPADVTDALIAFLTSTAPQTLHNS